MVGCVDRGSGQSTGTEGGQGVGGSSGFGGMVRGGAMSAGGGIGSGGTSEMSTQDGGGVEGAGGELDAGGMGGTGGGAVGSDWCDVGVYDAASPPKVLSLTGSLNTHDPSAIAADNTYYLFYTGLGAETSADLTAWKSAGSPFGTPSWLSSTISGVSNLWAPDVSQFAGKYHLYYAGSTFGSNKSCIGHATRDSLAAGSWIDDGAATICSNVNSSDNWNAIDPNLVVDMDGKAWLAFGSFWSGLQIIQLDNAGKRVGATVTAIASRPNKGGALEAPFMVRRCGYYYLFMSWDTCCKGADSTYNIRVVRGTSVTGPFTDKAGTAALQGGGSLIAEGDASFAGPGGQSVMFVGNRAYLVYHAYAKPSGATTLRIAGLVWDSTGWPVSVGP
jgi:arabinan endo-1,5-alpha-L-arabinosidase